MPRFLLLSLCAVLLSSCSANKHKYEFMEYVNNNDLRMASNYYAKNKNNMYDEDTDKTVKMAFTQLDQSYNSNAELLSAMLLHVNNNFKDQENWSFLKANIEKGHALIDLKQKNSELINQADSTNIDILNKTLSTIETNYQNSLAGIFEDFNHFAGENFFDVIPTEINSKESLLASSSLPKKMKSANLKKAAIFYKIYHKDFMGPYMDDHRKSVLQRSVSTFLKQHKKLTIFEASEFENHLNSLSLSSDILKLNTKPVIYILNPQEKGLVGITDSGTKLIYDNAEIKRSFSPPSSEENQYSIILIPRNSTINVVSETTNNKPSKFESGLKKVTNPEYTKNKAAKQEAIAQVSAAESELTKIKQQIYGVTQNSALRMNSVVTGQISEAEAINIPAVMLKLKEIAIESLKQTKANLELADITLMKTDKQISVTNYKDYQVKIREMEVQKTLYADIYVKASYQKNYYKYSNQFVENKHITLIERVNPKDKEMLQNKTDAQHAFDKYKQQNMSLQKDLLEVNKKMQYEGVVNSIDLKFFNYES